MITYVKKNNRLVPIGEGRLYTKKELFLREENGNNGEGYLSNSVNVQDAALQADKKLNGNPTLNTINMSGDDALSGKKVGNNTDARLQVNTKSKESIQQTQNILSRMSPAERANVDVTFKNGVKANEGRLYEMRRNSIPFTKAEMTRFLKSI